MITATGIIFVYLISAGIILTIRNRYLYTVTMSDDRVYSNINIDKYLMSISLLPLMNTIFIAIFLITMYKLRCKSKLR